jgi:hypothetical protein
LKAITLTKVFSFLVGACIALLGVAWIFIATSGAIKTGSVAGYIASAGFLLVAAPLLAFPFSVRVTKALLVLAMLALAFGMLWLTFQPNLPTNHPAVVQAAAIAFAVTLFARVGLAMRRKCSALGS